MAELNFYCGTMDAGKSTLALQTNYKDPDAVRYYLGQLNEERKRPDDALRWYSSIEDGEQYVPARARYAAILAKQGKIGEARPHARQAYERLSKIKWVVESDPAGLERMKKLGTVD